MESGNNNEVKNINIGGNDQGDAEIRHLQQEGKYMQSTPNTQEGRDVPGGPAGCGCGETPGETDVLVHSGSREVISGSGGEPSYGSDQEPCPDPGKNAVSGTVPAKGGRISGGLPCDAASTGQQDGQKAGHRHKNQPYYTESVKKAKQKQIGAGHLVLVALLGSVLGACIMFAATIFLAPVIRPAVEGWLGMAEEASETANLPEDSEVTKRVEIVQSSSPVEAIAEKVGRSVVGIQITVQPSGRNFFFDFGEGGVGYGSGIIIRKDGYILTNNHVVEGALESDTNRLVKGARIEVVLPSDKDKLHTAQVVGRDDNTDIAVLKIDADNLPVAELGDSDKVKPGELAVAIGNPGGIEYMGSVTAGVISGVNRKLTLSNGREFKLIQTDAAINPGNSGGALVNSKGQVIGINTVKIAATEVEGLGFAIPINEANAIADNLIKYKYVKGQAFLGVRIDQSFTAERAEMYKVPNGLLVYEVLPLSAAYKAGIHAGDIITEFDGVKVETFQELLDQISKHKPGDEVAVEIYRDGETLEIKVMLGEDKPIE